MAASLRCRYGEGSELYQRRKRQLLGVFDVLELDENRCLPVGHQVEMLTQLLGHEEASQEMALLIARELDEEPADFHPGKLEGLAGIWAAAARSRSHAAAGPRPW